ncbi:threonine synthase [Saccharopolyspora sp. NFXS83]|uniref:threonine synthase n=1 Tax=Saccharopolyspora sp. NFXS83 TaxID=2993560 RepID=UPI00224A5673|nr:PLP-dependent lyase/thiolase [Saccharopolyspora sp. NFXS83]
MPHAVPAGTPAPEVVMNDRLTDLVCLRCGRAYPVADHTAGCPRCLEQGSPANLRCRYDGDPVGELALNGARTLGEGGTPLFPLPAGLAPDGVEVWVKNESANPTGSHKDRFSWGAVGRAAAAGYESVVAASSGNAAVSLAAYAAAYGLGCDLAVTRDVPTAISDAVRDTGARLHVFDTAEQRWEFVRDHGADPVRLPVTNYARPVVGSSPYGVDAMRPIGWEIVEVLGRVPDHVLLPTARGDLAYGTYLGLREMARRHGRPCPRIHLVEPFPRLRAVLAGAGVHDSFAGDAAATPSIGGDSTTLQALRVLEDTGGVAVVVDTGVEQARIGLARNGILLEGASAIVLPALRSLHDRIAPGETAVLLATAHPFKGL